MFSENKCFPANEKADYLSVKSFSSDTYTKEYILVLNTQRIDAAHPLHKIEKPLQDQDVCSFQSVGYKKAGGDDCCLQAVTSCTD